MVIEDFTVDLDPVSHGPKDVDDGAPNRTLAAPGFTDKSERFALMEIEADAIHCAHLRAHYNPVSLTQATEWLKAGGREIPSELMHGPRSERDS